MASNRFGHRRLIKTLPKEGLFLFECDNKTDICRTSRIINDRDEIVEGNVVSVVYGQKQLKAKIMKLSGATLSYSINEV